MARYDKQEDEGVVEMIGSDRPVFLCKGKRALLEEVAELYDLYQDEKLLERCDCSLDTLGEIKLRFL